VDDAEVKKRGGDDAPGLVGEACSPEATARHPRPTHVRLTIPVTGDNPCRSQGR